MSALDVAALPAIPYKGLIPYAEADAPFFFGREAEQELIVANLMASRLTLLFGASGVGKSSLLRAGVAHRLRQQASEHLRVSGAPESAVVVFSTWRDDPLAGLARAIQSSVRRAWNGRQLDSASGANATARSPDKPLIETLQACADFIDGELVILLDQFEEYFLYHPKEDGDGTFAVEFPRAISSSNVRASFLIAIREDAVAKLDRFEGRIPNLFTNYLRIEHLDHKAARAAIEHPIEHYNRVSDQRGAGVHVRIEPELVQAVLDQVTIGRVVLGETGRGAVEESADLSSTHEVERIETPYLQLVMTRLWQEDVLGSGTLGAVASGPRTLSLNTLDGLGGAERIVRTHLDATMAALPPPQREVASHIFHYLVTPSGSKIAHSAADLAEYARLPETDVTPVLELLSASGARVLLPIAPPIDQPHVARYEIFHDVLATAILDWRSRYAQARELAEAEQKLALERRRAWRLRAGLIGVSVLLVAVVGLAIFAIQQRDAARFAQQIALSRGVAATALAQLPTQPDRSLLLALSAARMAQTSQTEDALRTVLLDPSRAVLRGHTGRINSVSVSPDGGLVATGGEDGTARLWDARTGELVSELTGHTRAVNGAAFTPDGSRLITASNDNTTRVWDVASSRLLLLLAGHQIALGTSGMPTSGDRVVVSIDTSARVWDMRSGAPLADLRGHVGLVTVAVFSADGSLVATASRDGTARVWAASSGDLVSVLRGHGGSVESVAFSPDGRLLVTTSRDTTGRIWEAATGTPVAELHGHTGAVTSGSFSPDGRSVLTASDDGTARLWEAQTGKRLTELRGHGGFVTSARFSPDGRFVVTGSTDKVARVWDLRNEQRIAELRGHAGAVTGAELGPATGQIVVTSSEDGTARVWAFDPGQSAAELHGHRSWVDAAVLSPDGQRVLTASLDGTARIWEAGTGRLMEQLQGHTGLLASAVFNRDGSSIATASDDHTARVWNAHTGQLVTELLGHVGPVNAVAFSPDGKWVGTAGTDATARVWDPVSGRAAATLTGHTGPVESLAFSPDSTSVITTGRDGTARVWDAIGGRPRVEMRGHGGSVNAAHFSADGSRVVTASLDNTARVWDTHSGRGLLELRGHARGVTAVQFSPDATQIVSASEDGSARVWDARTGRRLLDLQHAGPVTSAGFSPDGKLILTASEDHTARVWEAATGRVVRELRGHTMPLTGAVFGPSNTVIVTGGRDGTARVYLCEVCGTLDQLIELGSQRVTRALTPDERRTYLDESSVPGDTSVS